MCSERGWVCDGSHSLLSPGLVRSRAWETECGIVQCLCSLKQRRQTWWANWERGKAPPHPKQPKTKESWGGRRFGNQFLSTDELRLWGEGVVPIKLLLIVFPHHFISSVPERLPQRRLPYLLCFITVVRYPSLGASGPSPLIFHWNMAWAPLFFSLGCEHALLATSWMVGTLACSLTASLPLLCFSPFFPPLFSSSSLLPLGGGKAVQIFQIYWKENRTGVGSSCAASSKCFSKSHSVETPLQSNGVSNQLRHPPALNGDIPAAINKLTLFSLNSGVAPISWAAAGVW